MHYLPEIRQPIAVRIGRTARASAQVALHEVGRYTRAFRQAGKAVSGVNAGPRDTDCAIKEHLDLEAV